MTIRSFKYVLISLLSLTLASAVFGQKTGGYKEVPNSDSGARSAAAFAVKAETEKSGKAQTLKAIAHAERQVVAGSNYRLCLKVVSAGEEAEAEIIHYVQVVVYVDLKGNFKLTSWEDSNCGDDEDDG